MFDKIFCINLDAREDRWIESKSEFDRVGWEVERFSALPTINQSMFGCLKMCLKYESSLICEDDVVFKDLRHLDLALAKLPKDWDLVSLGATVLAPHKKRVSKHLYEYENGWATQAVGYSRKMVRWVLDNFDTSGVIYDEWLRVNALPTRKCFIVKPMVAYQRPGFSDIRNRFTDYTKGFEDSEKLFL